MTTTQTVTAPRSGQRELSLPRLYALRSGYLFMGLGLAIVKWPHLPNASHMSMYEGVTICMLTAMSLLAFLGLCYPESSTFAVVSAAGVGAGQPCVAAHVP